MDEDIAAFARTFARFTAEMHRVAEATMESPVRDVLDRHLGEDASRLPVVAESYPPYDHANVQVALDAHLAREGGRTS
jgi:hypothetical protein